MPFVVLYDACVLYPAPLRDLLNRIANTGVVRACWTKPILDECFGSILAQRPDLKPEALAEPGRDVTRARRPRSPRFCRKILANKVTALVDRREPKDLADIWGFCCQMGLSLETALEGAQGKAVGLFAPDVARPLLESIREDWTLVRWIAAPEPAEWLHELRALGERLLLVPA